MLQVIIFLLGIMFQILAGLAFIGVFDSIYPFFIGIFGATFCLTEVLYDEQEKKFNK